MNIKWKLLKETTIPSDKETIKTSLVKDMTNEMFVPSVDFIRNAYEYLNKELFLGYLPSSKEVEFGLSDDIREDELGSATCNVNFARNMVWSSDFKLQLNKTARLTIHSWIGVVLHEMIHLMEYQEHPEFVKDKEYNWHGKRFKEIGDKFKKYGFDLSEFHDGNLEMDIDDERVAKIMKDEMFIQLGTTKKGIPQTIKILKQEKNKCFEFLKSIGIDEITLLNTNNPMSIKVLPTTIDELKSKSLTVHHIDDKFNKMYGPFIEVETIDLNNMVLEDSGNHDEQVETIRCQAGVIDAHRISPTTIRITVA